MGGSYLALEKVTLGYGDRLVLEGVSLEAGTGELLGIVGPNGCGKSTLIKSIARLVETRAGRISVGGRDVARMGRGDLARLVAAVPQNAVLPELFTSFEVVLMGRTPHLGTFRYEGRRDMAIARRCMEVTATWGMAARRVGELSGGERQRVCIARALAQEPRVLLLDEPTAHLDINHQVETLDLVRNLCREKGLVAVAALHDLNLAAQYCDRLVMLACGRVFHQGEAADVITARNIFEVYGTQVFIQPHPVNGLPQVLVTPDGHDKAAEVQALWMP